VADKRSRRGPFIGERRGKARAIGQVLAHGRTESTASSTRARCRLKQRRSVASDLA
jgi:hypothetical protein